MTDVLAFTITSALRQLVDQARGVAGAETVVDPELFGVNVDDGDAADAREAVEIKQFHYLFGMSYWWACIAPIQRLCHAGVAASLGFIAFSFLSHDASRS
jgi:hypothetical protein